MVEFLKGRFPIAAYSPPNPEVTFGGRKFHSAVNAMQYDRMRDLGINLVIGSGEGIGSPQEEEVFRAMKLCAERDMFYLPSDQIAREYCSDGVSHPLWRDLSDKQKKDLTNFVHDGGGNITPQEKGFFERLKDKFNM